MDPRYGCLLCPVLPHPGYLDRLRKGRDVGKQKYSLQHHVETHHPDIPDWQNLRTDLPKFKRPGDRKRRREAREKKKTESSPEPDSSSSSSRSEGSSKTRLAAADRPKRSLRRRQNLVDDDSEDSDTIVVKIGKGARQQEKARQQEEEEEEHTEEETDEEMTDAPPPKRVRNAPSAGPADTPVIVDEGQTDEGQTDEEMEDASPPRQTSQDIPSIPTPDTTTVLPRPPTRFPTVRTLMVANSAIGAAPYQRPTTVEGLRTHNIALTSSVQSYERANNGLRDDVRGLLYVTANAIETGLQGAEPTTQNVHRWLQIHAREDGGVPERFVARLVTELSRRYDESHGQRAPQPRRQPSVHQP